MSMIKSITKKQITTERLYNLAVSEDESYIANDIVVHNCKSYLVPNLRGAKNNPDITGLKPSNSKLEKLITLSENKKGCC